MHWWRSWYQPCLCSGRWCRNPNKALVPLVEWAFHRRTSIGSLQFTQIGRKLWYGRTRNLVFVCFCVFGHREASHPCSLSRFFSRVKTVEVCRETESPTTNPTASPTASPTANPTTSPTAIPTASPTVNPTASPTTSPTVSLAVGGCPAAAPLDDDCDDRCLYENIDRGLTRDAGLNPNEFVRLWNLDKTQRRKYIKNGFGKDGARCCFGEDACKDVGKDSWKDNKPEFLAPPMSHPDAPVCCRGKNACYSTEIRYGSGGISCNSVSNGNDDGYDEQQTCSGAWFIEGNPANGGYPALDANKLVGGRIPISCTGNQACYQVMFNNVEPTPVDICCNGIQTCYEFGYDSSFHGPPDLSSAECRDDVPNNGNTNTHSHTCYQASFTDLGKNNRKRSMDVCVMDAHGEGVSNDQEGYNLCGSDADCWCTKTNEIPWCTQSHDSNQSQFNLNKANLGAWHCTATGGQPALRERLIPATLYSP